jgi:hypothetical protein
MEDTSSSTTSDNRQSLAPNAPNGPSRKRQKTTSTISSPNPSNDDEHAAAAMIRKERNEDSCPIYKLSSDELKLILGYVGENKL